MSEAFDWDDLLLELSDRNIVPVVGRELLTLTTAAGETITVEQWVVSELIKYFSERGDLDEKSSGAFHDEMSLNAFTISYMQLFPIDKRENRKRIIKKQITRLLIDDAVDVPEILQKLASIEHFDLFISTSADTLLDQAIATIRGGCESRSFKLRSAPEDIDVPLTGPNVYHIFGTFDESQDFSVTDEDMVEFLHSTSTNGQPRHLLDYLSNKSLLLIGCGLSKTLLPFLVRTLANDRLFPSKNYRVVDDRLSRDAEITLFWRGFSGEMMLSNDTSQFVNELHDRWKSELAPTIEHQKMVNVTAKKDIAINNMKGFDADSCHVFISYRRSDQAAADRIVESLRSRKISVWYDQTNIQGGDDWMREVKKNIGSCLLFLPILSPNSQSDENVSIREWGLAFERRASINDELPFILPVSIDEGITPESELIDDRFGQYDFTLCSDGIVSNEFLDTVEQKIKQRIKARMR